MLLSIEHENGPRSEALLLSSGRYRMRVAPRGNGDTIELTMLDGQWYDERGRQVAFGAMIAIEGVDWRRMREVACSAQAAFH